jgi:hypothetical protein
MKGAERSLDPVAATALNEAMSAISERYWCAAWLRDLEFSLWAMLGGGPREYGLGEVSAEELDGLRRLAERAGGWWRWSDMDEDEVFVPFREWNTLMRERGE